MLANSGHYPAAASLRVFSVTLGYEYTFRLVNSVKNPRTSSTAMEAAKKDVSFEEQENTIKEAYIREYNTLIKIAIT